MSSVNGSISLNAGVVTNQHFSGAAADVLLATKMQHIYDAGSQFNLPIGGTPVNYEEVIFVANTSGTILNFQAMLVAVGSTSNMTFDLLKNGTTVLTTVATITNANTNRQVVAAVLNSTSFVTGDVFSAKLVMTTNTGAQGPRAWGRFQEAGAA